MVPHGLCKNAAIVLAEAGCSDHEIAAITGHRDLAMVQLYTRAVRNYRLPKTAVEKPRLAADAETAKVIALHVTTGPLPMGDAQCACDVSFWLLRSHAVIRRCPLGRRPKADMRRRFSGG